MQSTPLRWRLGVCALVALLIGGVAVLVPTPVLAMERSMGVDTEIPGGSVTALAQGPGGPVGKFGRPETNAFDMMGLSWKGVEEGSARVRVRTAAGWGPWTALEGDNEDAPDRDSPESAAHGTDRIWTRPLWVGKAEGYEVEAPSTDLQIHLVRERAWRVQLRPASGAGAAHGPPIGERGTWGARPPTDAPSRASTVKMAFVHHTVGSNSYEYNDVPRILRGHQAYHMDAQGWSDIGYNFLVDRFGRIWEGRAGGVDQAVIGAHTQGFNTGSTGVAVMGTFTSTEPPAAAVDATSRLLGWKLPKHGVVPGGSTQMTSGGNDRYPAGTRVSFNTVSGHRDAKATDCPGARLYGRLPEIRSKARQHAGPTDAQLGPGQQPLGGYLSSGPDAAAWEPNRLDVFVHGGDNQLWHRWWDGARWNGWEPLGGYITSGPGAAAWEPNRLDVFARGGDNQLWHKWWDGARWKGWEPLGGYLTSGPDVASWGPGRLDVFVRGGDNQLWHRAWVGTRWSPWFPLGGYLASDPTAVSWGPNRLDVFVRGGDNQLWHRWWDGARWNGWDPLGGHLTSGADVASPANGRLDLFVRGMDNGLHQRSFDGRQWLNWRPLGGQLSSDPSAVSWGGDRIDVFVRAPDSALYQKSFPPGT